MKIEEIEAALRQEPSQIREDIVRDIGNYTVALFGVKETKEGELLELAGTGTLVTVAGSYYVLTADHVWEERLRNARLMGITLKENTDHRYLMETKEIAQSGLPTPEDWGEWGPDMAFLRVPPERVGSILAYRIFYNLEIPRQVPEVDHVELYLLMGTPKATGTFTKTHADLQILGFFSDLGAPVQSPGGFDYLDLNTGELSPEIPNDFGGVSGGGLWRVQVYWSAPSGDIKWRRSLEGVAFFHKTDSRVLRCHGAQSIRQAMRGLPNAQP